MIFTSVTLAQGTGLIVGKVLDKELENEPLAFAHISIENTKIASSSDLSGMFLLENLEDGNYTVIVEFPGYETKYVSVDIASGNPVELHLALGAQSINLNELAALENEQHATVSETQPEKLQATKS